jgi:predicted DNA-binding WGR domain protein
MYLGRLQGASGALSVVFVDGARAVAWAGWDGSEDGRNRTMLQDWEDTEAGTQVFIGSAGAATVWKTDDGVAFLDFFPSETFESDDKAGIAELAKRATSLRAKGKPKSEGFIQIESGCVAAMLEYAEPTGLSKSVLTKGTKAFTSFHDHGVLVPLANGRYQIVTEKLNHSDAIGLCETRTRLVRVADKAKPTSKPAPKAAKVDVDIFGNRAAPWGSLVGMEPFELIALDADDAPRYDGDGDFERAFALTGKKVGGPLTTKAGATGVVARMGLGLGVSFWKLERGVALLDFDPAPKLLDIKTKTGKEFQGAYVAQLPAKQSTLVGTVVVRSGALCVMRTMAHPKSAPRPAGDKPKVMTAGAGVETGASFPVENGTYEVHRDLLGDERKGLVTEFGRLHVRMRFLRAAKGAAAAKPAAAKAVPAKAAPSKAAPAKAARAAPAKGRVHLELSEGTSNKFWEAWVEGSTLHVRFGRIGTDGQTKPKQFPTPAAATAERDSLVASKRRKGYA